MPHEREAYSLAKPRSYLDLGLGFFAAVEALARAKALADGLETVVEAAAFLASSATSAVRALMSELSFSDLVWSADNLVEILARGLALGMKGNLASRMIQGL